MAPNERARRKALAWFFYTQTKRYANAKSSTGNFYI
jgi:hypothetical protein